MTLAICERLRWQYVHEAAPEETQAAAETIDALYEALADLIARCDANQRPGGGSMVPPSARAALTKAEER